MKLAAAIMLWLTFQCPTEIMKMTLKILAFFTAPPIFTNAYAADSRVGAVAAKPVAGGRLRDACQRERETGRSHPR